MLFSSHYGSQGFGHGEQPFYKMGLKDSCLGTNAADMPIPCEPTAAFDYLVSKSLIFKLKVLCNLCHSYYTARYFIL